MNAKKRAAEVSTEAAKLIRTGFVKHAFAADEKGDRIEYFDARACQFCAMGAISRAAYNLKVPMNEDSVVRGRVMAALTTRMETEKIFVSIPQWNDDPKTTAEQVASMFDQTAAYLEQDA